MDPVVSSKSSHRSAVQSCQSVQSQLQMPLRPELEPPFLALDSSTTKHHENAIRVTAIEGGFRAELAVVDPSQIPALEEFRRSGSTSRLDWQLLTNTLYQHDSPHISAGLQQDRSTLALVVAVDFLSGAATPANVAILPDQMITTHYLGFNCLGEALGRRQSGLEFESQHLLTAKAAMSFFSQRRARGDVVFADVNSGLVLQPDGSWEKYCPEDLLGRVAVQEITTAILAALSEHACDKGIPLLYRGCSAAEPELIERLSDHLKNNEHINRCGIDELLIDQRGRRRRLLGRAVCSASPIPHVAIGGKAYSRVSAPMRVFQDFVNISQLLAWARAESPPYSQSQLILMAKEVNNNSERRIRRKGACKYPALIAHDLAALELNPDATPKMIRSLIASCRDAADFPLAAVDRLLEVVKLDPQIGLPILSDLCFNMDFEKHFLLGREIRSFLDRNPSLIDSIISKGIDDHSLKEFHLIKNTSQQKEVLESLWFAGHRVSILEVEQAVNTALPSSSKLALLNREHFRAFLGGIRRPSESNFSDFSVGPKLASLYKLTQDIYKHCHIRFDSKRSQNSEPCIHLTLVGQRNDCVLENAFDDPGVGPSFLDAAENAAQKLLLIHDINTAALQA